MVTEMKNREKKTGSGKARPLAFAFYFSAFVLLAGQASAACSTPTGAAGDQFFNTTHSVMQYCDGANWVNMGSPGSGALGDGDKGDITVSSDGAAWAIDSGAVTNSMLAGSITLSKIDATGTPSSSTYLRGDGSWQAAGAASGTLCGLATRAATTDCGSGSGFSSVATCEGASIASTCPSGYTQRTINTGTFNSGGDTGYNCSRTCSKN
jgi:hypothetical protein